ncbi:two-component system response regulator [Parathermosynechococcus lividus PCC 6715]|uniref:Two-component system response regulator n=1 Tax=Parathermosynechococcus lividus PCC 6715 TaxID=1917166 RepID=A0A2D2PZ43_PARLV|nr:response regulator [Thermostichus lividus]ATS17519.1 two-component system response regulator [Thermostichus lividus PCC 6715]
MSTVLVVEDTPSEMALIASFLKDSGYTVISATDAKEALQKVTQYKPDVVVTDVVMPGMSGFELCRSLKKNPETEKLPIIVCTSKNQELDRLWAMKQGADAYITKPFSREDLLRALKSVVV